MTGRSHFLSRRPNPIAGAPISATRSSFTSSRLPGAIALLGGATFTFFGVWAMVAPRSFFDAVAAFEPYNEHFLLDIGAFQVGLGAVLLIAALAPRKDALAVGLTGVSFGAAAHTVSHILGRDLGGTPTVDIPVFSILTILLVFGGVMRWRELPTEGEPSTG